MYFSVKMRDEPLSEDLGTLVGGEKGGGNWAFFNTGGRGHRLPPREHFEREKQPIPWCHSDFLSGLEATGVVRRKCPQNLEDEILASYQINLV